MPRGLSHVIKRLLLFLVTGSVALVIAACYGVRMPIPSGLVFWLLKVVNPQGQPVAGLKVTIRNICQPGAPDTVETLFTDTSGTAFFSYNDPNGGPYLKRDSTFAATITDVDGASNGGPYRDTTIALPARDTTDPIAVTVREQ